MPSAEPPDDPPDRAPVPIVPVHVCVVRFRENVRSVVMRVCMCACEVVGVRRCVPEIVQPLGSADELVCVYKGDGKYSCVDCVPPCLCAFFGAIICAWVRAAV